VKEKKEGETERKREREKEPEPEAVQPSTLARVLVQAGGSICTGLVSTEK